MAPAGKRVHKPCRARVTLFPKFLRFFCPGRRRPLRFIRRGVLGSASRTNEEPFVAPKLDRSKLVIEELKMGFYGNQHLKAEFGIEVSIACEYKSEGGQCLEKADHTLVLGRSSVVRALHDGIRGMSLGDKRRLYIPPSLQSGGRSICEVTLTQVHKRRNQFNT